jgi:hypothetical protein
MSRLFIAPYNMGSASAKLLSQALSAPRVTGDKLFRCTDLVINWGRSDLVIRGNPKIINHPTAVGKAANKLLTFQTLSGVVPTVDNQ